jgi:hypothetical protein
VNGAHVDGGWAQEAVSIRKWKVFSRVKRLFYGIPSWRVKGTSEFSGAVFFRNRIFVLFFVLNEK